MNCVRPPDLVSDLPVLLLIFPIFLQSTKSSIALHIRINCFEVRQESVWVSHPHVLHELVIHPEYDKHVNLLGFQTHVEVRHNQLDTRQDTLTKRLSVQGTECSHRYHGLISELC